MIDVALSIDKYLTLCGQIEKVSAQIYAHWSQCPEFDSQTKKLWLQMKLEEDDHYAQIEMLRRLHRHADSEEEADEGEYAQEMFEYAQKILQQISSASMSKIKSLELAIQLEETLKDFHAGQACHFEDPGLERMFANLSSQDKLHSDRLKQVYADIRKQTDARMNAQ